MSQRMRDPETAQEAMAQAALHARRAMAEALRAGRALLDAASLAAFGGPARSADAEVSRNELRGAIAGLALRLDALADVIAEPGAGLDDLQPGLVDALMEALAAEIERWEQRSADDPDARAVLRAFLGLRELLWELGARPTGSRRDRSGPVRSRPSEASSRVRRVEVQS